jgi:hypothetical protein
MCQHFSGHIVKQILAAFQILQATGSHCWTRTLFSGSEKSSRRQRYPSSWLYGSCFVEWPLSLEQFSVAVKGVLTAQIGVPE